MKMLTECSASHSWGFISSSIYLIRKRLFRVQHLLWSLCHKAFWNAYAEPWDWSWRNTEGGVGACLLCSFQVFCSTGETARRPCPFSEAEQKAFVLDLCWMQETWVLYNADIPGVLKHTNQAVKGNCLLFIYHSPTPLPPMYVLSLVFSSAKQMVRTPSWSFVFFYHCPPIEYSKYLSSWFSL